MAKTTTKKYFGEDNVKTTRKASGRKATGTTAERPRRKYTRRATTAGRRTNAVSTEGYVSIQVPANLAFEIGRQIGSLNL